MQQTPTILLSRPFQEPSESLYLADYLADYSRNHAINVSLIGYVTYKIFLYVTGNTITSSYAIVKGVSITYILLYLAYMERVREQGENLPIHDR